MSDYCKKLCIKIKSLTVFRGLLDDCILKSLVDVLDSKGSDDLADTVFLYCEFVSKLYGSGFSSLPLYLEHIIYNTENPYIKIIGKGEKPSECMRESVLCELLVLQELLNLTPEKIINKSEYKGYVPKFETANIDITDGYLKRTENISKYGYGIYADNHIFYVDGNGKILPVKNPDNISLSDLVDYKREQDIIVENTKALLDGKPAANILLTGDAGTGKSSTVKAVVNKFFRDGLRILEVRKEQLCFIPNILDELSDNPLKFILFIDDLSFSKDDDNFNALKAVLEGSVFAKSKNVVIYATSNRRHIVKERMSDREGDEVHRNDSMQELISLSERFGIHITYQKPDKKTFLNIVRHLAKENNIDMETKELELLSERFALQRGGRSARLARQFIDGLLSK